MRTFITKNCDYCNKEILKSVGHVNRALKKGSVNFFCSEKCTQHFKKALCYKSLDVKKQEKSEYDKIRRNKLKNIIKVKKKEAYEKLKVENLELLRSKQKEQRKSQKESDYRKNYINTEKYRKYKYNYDQVYRSKKYGEFSESYLLLKDLKKEIDNRKTKIESELTNKSQKRKRECQRKTNLRS